MKKPTFLLMAALAAFAVVQNRQAAAQTAPTNGPAVHMIITAEAAHGSNLPPISREDVMVYEGKTRDKVTDWVPAQGNNAALELYILIDDSADSSLGSQLDYISKFINAQPSTAKIGVAYMQNGTANVLQDLTSDHAKAAKSLRLPMGEFGINASPYTSLGDLVKRWPADDARHEVLIVSSGIDPLYGVGDLQDPYVEGAIDEAQRAGVLVYTIYTPGAGHTAHTFSLTWWGQMYLSQVSEQTGGESYYFGFTGPPVSFTPYLDDIGRHLDHQYWLTFLAKPEEKAGLQRVRVTTELPKTQLVGASRVFVPAQP